MFSLRNITLQTATNYSRNSYTKGIDFEFRWSNKSKWNIECKKKAAIEIPKVLRIVIPNPDVLFTN